MRHSPVPAIDDTVQIANDPVVTVDQAARGTAAAIHGCHRSRIHVSHNVIVQRHPAHARSRAAGNMTVQHGRLDLVAAGWSPW